MSMERPDCISDANLISTKLWSKYSRLRELDMMHLLKTGKWFHLTSKYNEGFPGKEIPAHKRAQCVQFCKYAATPFSEFSYFVITFVLFHVSRALQVLYSRPCSPDFVALHYVVSDAVLKVNACTTYPVVIISLVGLCCSDVLLRLSEHWRVGEYFRAMWVCT